MNKEATTTETVLLPEDDLIPLALIAVEIGDSVDRLAHRFGKDVVLDDIGMRAIAADTARRFFTEQAEWKARSDEEHRRRFEEAAQKERVPAGVPGVEGLTPLEVMMQSGDYQTPEDEFRRFPGGVFQELFDAQLAEGQRRSAERRRLAEEREKERLADKMKDDLQ